MKNIIEVAFELIEKNGKTTIEEIIANVDNVVLNELDPRELEAVVYSDLLVNGKFISIDGGWDLKEKYTMKDITKEQYRNIGDFVIEEAVFVDEEEDEPVAFVVDLGDDENNDVVASIDEIDDFATFSDSNEN